MSDEAAAQGAQGFMTTRRMPEVSGISFYFILVASMIIMIGVSEGFTVRSSTIRAHRCLPLTASRRASSSSNSFRSKARRPSAVASTEGMKKRKMNKKGNPGLTKKTTKRDHIDKRKLDRRLSASGPIEHNKNRTPNLHQKEIRRAEERSQAVLPGQTSRAPPWQILSPQDVRKNAEVALKRRLLARNGELELDESSNDDGSARLDPLQPARDDEDVVGVKTKLLSKALMTEAERSIIRWQRFNPTTVPCGMTFIGSYLDRRLPPRIGVPEVAFLGRSNVGKSSLLNKLCRRSGSGFGGGSSGTKDEARVGKTPGATASVNLYAMLGKRGSSEVARPILGLTDLPGFGYAKLSKGVQDSVQRAAERYLGKREELALGILLVDARRVPSDDDRAVLAALYDLGVPLVVVATKMDKLNKNEVEKAMETIRTELGLPDEQPLRVSSVTGEGTKLLWSILLEACEERVDELRDQLERVDDEEVGLNGRDDEDDSVAFIRLDDEGNPLVPYDDGSELPYGQGYDWIHNEGVFYEPEDSDFKEEEEEEYDTSSTIASDFVNPSFSRELADMNIKDLDKMVKRMEKRGEI